MIKIGTSGYSFKDWLGAFYPENLPPGKMLDHYAGHFKTVEINSTYYRIPHAKVFDHLANKVPADFDFMVKVNRDLTHKSKPDTNSMDLLFLSLEGLIQAGKLKGFLAQFPYSFKPGAQNLEHIIQSRRACRGFPLFIEFRNRGWLTEETYKVLEQNDVGYVNVDEPPLFNLVPPQALVTNGTGYIRFHGRNAKTWWDPEAGDRYDYSYSTEELSEWLPIIKEIEHQAYSDTYLFFNNCHMGQAVKNAKTMRALIKDQIGLEVV
jgi:uncharacterized protein YecE (DUF72 family)